MSVGRRHFLHFGAAGIATGILASVEPANRRNLSKINAIAFDAFPIFDPRPVFALPNNFFLEKELSCAMSGARLPGMVGCNSLTSRTPPRGSLSKCRPAASCAPRAPCHEHAPARYPAM